MKAWRPVAGLLLVALVWWPAFSAHAEGPTRVWVDDHYCASCANDKHTWGVDAFDTISAGVAAVAPGGRVNILSGRYEEDVRIAQPCKLVAQGSGKAILRPRLGASTIVVAANDVTVQGLTIEDSRQAAIQVLGPDFQREPIRGVVVRGNTIKGGQFGVAVNIDSEWNYGALPATGVEIGSNTVAGCTRAIYVYNSEASITGNTISGLSPDGIGIYSSQNSRSRIDGNRVDVDAPNGQAIYILDNQGTAIEGNTLVGATEALSPTTGVALYGYTDLVLSKNTIRGFNWGANAFTGGSARIAGNTFDSAVTSALNLGTAITTTQVTVVDNVIRGSYQGLKLDDDGGNGLLATVVGNTFQDNVVGIGLAPSLQSGQATLRGNVLCGNLVAGLRNDSATAADAVENWWGARDGPRPDGSGDRVEGPGGATVDPWLRLTATAETAPDGQVTIAASLGDERYPVRGATLRFAVNGGTFADTSSASQTAVTDAAGQARVVLSPLAGLPASVTVSADCGQGVTVSLAPSQLAPTPTPVPTPPLTPPWLRNLLRFRLFR